MQKRITLDVATMPNKSDLYVIIVTFNGEKWIKKCLESVLNSSVSANIIIVDNASTDDTVNIIKSQFNIVRLIESNSNLGFGKANNIGIREAILGGGKYIYLLNQDAYVCKNTFECLVNGMDTHAEFAILSPIQTNGEGHRVDKLFLRNVLEDSTPELINDYAIGNHLNDVYPTSFVMAAHWMMRIKALEEVGLFSEAFPHYGEDNNLIYRFQYYGWKIGIMPGVYAFHDRENRESSSSSAQLYHLYIYILSIFHDIYHDSKYYRRKNTIKLYFKIVLLSGPSIKEKIRTLCKCISAQMDARKWRAKYKSGAVFLFEDKNINI